jgi:hypothetical protein
VLWIVLGVVFGVGALPLTAQGTYVGSSGRRLLCLATSMWLFAPFLGPFGLVFVRLPLLQVASVAGLQHMCLLLESRRIPDEIG